MDDSQQLRLPSHRRYDSRSSVGLSDNGLGGED